MVAKSLYDYLKNMLMFHMGSCGRYVSRVTARDDSNHVILGTQQFKPTEFATQISLNMDNAWGILRCVIDLCMKQEDGKYLILRDPNKVRACILNRSTFI